MIQYRLSVGGGFTRDSDLYAQAYLPLQRRNWSRYWPDGLLIPDPNLPNRSPLMSASPSLVPVALDPLRRRAPLSRWQATSARDIDRMVRGLARYLPDDQMRLLDRYLHDARESSPVRELAVVCDVIRRGLAGQAQRLQLKCSEASVETESLEVRAEVRLTPDGSATGHVRWLAIGDGSYTRLDMSGDAEQRQERSELVLRFTGNFDERSVRAPDGNSILALSLEWQTGETRSATRFQASGKLSIANDFQPLARTFERMAADVSSGSPLLAERFDASRLSHWLLAELGALSAPRCCEPRPAPSAKLDLVAGTAGAELAVALEHRGPLRTFRHYCGACHSGDTANPPGFLRGSGESTVNQVRQCAERVYYRLSMWSRPHEAQSVPPMPPVQGLSIAGISIDDWRRGESLERLTEYARKLLVKGGRNPAELLDGNYHDARSCLATREPTDEVTQEKL